MAEIFFFEQVFEDKTDQRIDHLAEEMIVTELDSLQNLRSLLLLAQFQFKKNGQHSFGLKSDQRIVFHLDHLPTILNQAAFDILADIKATVQKLFFFSEPSKINMFGMPLPIGRTIQLIEESSNLPTRLPSHKNSGFEDEHLSLISKC